MDSTRAHFIERHDFYVAQVKLRVLNQFRDLEGEADRFAESEFERLGNLPARDDIDMADVAEAAHENAQNFYSLLDDLREQSLLSALAGCFHQWDKELREFLERELMHTMPTREREEFAWHPDWTKILDGLDQFGWDVRASSCFRYLDAGRLIVNVYKHGKGRSLSDLAQRFPKYIHDPLAGLSRSFNSEYLDHSWVNISEAEFDEIAKKGIRRFWTQFPELMFYPSA